MPPNRADEAIALEDSFNQIIETTPYFDIQIAKDALFDGAYQVVSCVFTDWKRENLDFYQYKNGITNQLVKVTYKPNDFSVLVRAYGRGSELIIDRNQEVVNIITLASQHMCPPLYARFKNGLVYGFIKGKVSSVEELGQEATAEWIAKKLGKWHQVKLKDSKQVNKLWQTMFKWLDQVPEEYKDPKIQSRFLNYFDMKQIRKELHMLIYTLEKLDSRVVFSHNDLLYGNIIYDEKEAHFIDYEYGGYASRGFDIGNHFNEFAGFECDYSKYPTKEFQFKWFEWYLTSNGVTPSEKEKMILYKEVEGYSLASHFYWGLWALIQAMVSDIDFNYMDYSILRFEEYKRRKDQVLSSLD